MFRQMRRNRQQLSRERCEEILSRATSGVLAVLGDEGYPYAVPLSYVYSEGKFYFHCARQGHKLDAIRREPKASFCVIDERPSRSWRFAMRRRTVKTTASGPLSRTGSRCVCWR